MRWRWRSWSFGAFAEQAQNNFILAFLPRRLRFWIPAQVLTVVMLAKWRVFIATVVAIALGSILSVGRGVAGGERRSRDPRRCAAPASGRNHNSEESDCAWDEPDGIGELAVGQVKQRTRSGEVGEVRLELCV